VVNVHTVFSEKVHIFLKENKMNKRMGNLMLGAILMSLLIANFVLGALPVVTGYSVEVYAEPPYPVHLCFSPTGEMYAGWDDGSGTGAGSISRIAPGGGPGSVSSIGPATSDPDSVAYDVTGQISGFPGSVIVGGGYSPHLTAIRPDGIAQVLWTDPFVNPTDIAFDSTGRMLFVDASYPGVFVTTGAQPVLLFSTPTYDASVIVVGDDDNIYISHEEGGQAWIRGYDRDGNSLGNPLVELDIANIVPFDFGPGGSWGNALYFIADHELLKVDFPNAPITIGTGFASTSYHEIVFGPDDALYISDRAESCVLRIAPKIIEVDIDIKPGSCPNPLNVKDKGVLSVAILGTTAFNVFDIDVASIRLEGISPIRSSYEDVATPFEGQICECHELGADGYLDLTLKFAIQEIFKALGNVNDGDEVILTVSGNISDGRDFEGLDCVTIISKNNK
jgi:hypothetical protein